MFQTKLERKSKHTIHVQKLLSVNRAVKGNKAENYGRTGRAQMTIRRMRVACWVTKATDTHSEYVISLAV